MNRAHDLIGKIAKTKKATPDVILNALDLIATGEASAAQAAALAMGLRMAVWPDFAPPKEKTP